MAEKDAIEVEGAFLKLPPDAMLRGEIPNGHSVLPHSSEIKVFASIRILPEREVLLGMRLYFLRTAQQPYVKSSEQPWSLWEGPFPERFFVLHIPPDLFHESKSIRQTPLRKLPHREAQKRGPRDLQECAPQAAARLIYIQAYAPTPRR